MEQIIITRVNGTTLKLQSKENYSTITKAIQNVELLGVDVVDITVESAVKMNFYIGDKITIIGRDYTLNSPAKELKRSEREFTYDLHFEGVQYDLLRATYNVNVDTTSNSIQDINGSSLTGDMKLFLDVLISNANRVFPGKWSLGTYPANTETRTEVFGENDNCLSVLQTLCSADKFDTEFRIDIAVNGHRTIYIGATGNLHTYTYEYGKGHGIFELIREKISSSNIITRLNVFGSTKNIVTSKYRAQRLCLPEKTKSQSFIQDSAAITKYGVWEYTKIFEEIYPRRTGVISSLGDNELKFIDTSMNFDLNEKELDGVTTKYLVPGSPAKVKFNTGNLAGYEFEIYAYNHAAKQFTLKAQTDENGYTFPSSSTAAFQFAAGDKYVLIDIYMPQSYIDTAEADLNTKGLDFYSKNSQPRVQYGLKVDPFFLKNVVGEEAESNIIWVGDYIPIKDTDLEVDKTIRVKSFNRDLQQQYSYSFTIADLPITVTIINRVVSDIKGIDNIIRINNLNDPARARKNWLNAQEVLNMVFDPEGNFYTEKIRPESVDTLMLSVGAKSMQFGLVGTILQPNYSGNKNRVVYTGGTLTHYAILDSNEDPRVWNITDGDIVLATDAAYYIYVKCAKVGTGASLVFSTSKIAVESDTSYYHLLMGVLNSVDTNNARAVALMYGFTTINGRFIKTGRIVSNDGEKYFDLDAGEFKGDFKFTSGTSVETAVSNAATAANTAQTDATNALSQLTNIVSDNVLSAAEKPSQRKEWDIVSGEKAGIVAQANAFGESTYGYEYSFSDLATYLNNNITWSSGVPSWLADAALGTNTVIVGATYRSKWSTLYSQRQTLLNAIAAKAKALADSAQASVDMLNIRTGLSVFSEYFKETQEQFNSRWTNNSGSGELAVVTSTDATGGNILRIGNQSGNDQVWIIENNSIPFDPSRLYVVKARVRRISGSGTFYMGIAGRDATDTVWVNATGANSSASQHYVAAAGQAPGTSWVEYKGYFKGYGATFANANDPLNPTPLHANVRYIRPLLIANYASQAGVYEVDYVSINYAEAELAQATAQALNYLKIALQGSTDISGGLLATNVLLMKNSNNAITGGMSGLTDDNVGMWTGGTYADAIASLSKIIMRKDGSGQLAGGKITFDLNGGLKVGDFDVQGGSIIGYADNKDKVKFHTGAIDTLANLVAGTWVQAPSTYAINYPDYAVNSGSSPITIVRTYYAETAYLTVPANAQVKFNPATISISFSPSGYSPTVNQYYEVWKDGSLVATYAPSTSTIRTLVAGGTYTIKFRYLVSFDLAAYTGVNFSISTSSAGTITYQPSIEKTEIGKDGFFSFWSSVMYLYFSATDGLKVKGACDIPGMLASGSVGSTGGLSRSFGKASSATKNSTGNYTITHSIGHSDYSVQITPQATTRLFYISARGNTTCTIIMTNTSGTATDTAFDFAICGSN